jgi:hypothetical protein
MRWLVVIVAVLSALISVPMLGFSVMLFDAPGSENDTALGWAVISMLLIPIGAIACVIWMIRARPPAAPKWGRALAALLLPWLSLIASLSQAYQ